jgi:DNA-binding response OmpR family regulator
VTAPDAWRAAARILIVDDLDANAELLQRFFERDGLGGSVAITDARLVEAAIAGQVPDLVLLDVNMPHINGLDLLERLAPCLHGAGVPVAIVTADVTREVRGRARALGVRDVILKPYDIGDMLLRVTNLLDIRYLSLALAATRDS